MSNTYAPLRLCKTSHKNISGFTIVELLIVIVVIAIIAAISTVAYNGIQQRARETVMQGQLSNAKKKIDLFVITEGQFPDTAPENVEKVGATFTFPVSSRNLIMCTNGYFKTEEGFSIVAHDLDIPDDWYALSTTSEGFRSVFPTSTEAPDLCATTAHGVGKWGSYWSKQVGS